VIHYPTVARSLICNGHSRSRRKLIQRSPSDANDSQGQQGRTVVKTLVIAPNRYSLIFAEMMEKVPDHAGTRTPASAGAPALRMLARDKGYTFRRELELAILAAGSNRETDPA